MHACVEAGRSFTGAFSPADPAVYLVHGCTRAAVSAMLWHAGGVQRAKRADGL